MTRFCIEFRQNVPYVMHEQGREGMIRPRGNKTKFMFNSTMKFFLLINVEMPTSVGIYTFMSRKNNILGLSEPKKAEFLAICILMSILNFMLS